MECFQCSFVRHRTLSQIMTFWLCYMSVYLLSVNSTAVKAWNEWFIHQMMLLPPLFDFVSESYQKSMKLVMFYQFHRLHRVKIFLHCRHLLLLLLYRKLFCFLCWFKSGTLVCTDWLKASLSYYRSNSRLNSSCMRRLGAGILNSCNILSDIIRHRSSKEIKTHSAQISRSGFSVVVRSRCKMFSTILSCIYSTIYVGSMDDMLKL